MTLPRSSTGLVPRSHHIQMDRKASPNNYRQLPPRPPPEEYPYRGSRKTKSSITSINQKSAMKLKKRDSNNNKQRCFGPQKVAIKRASTKPTNKKNIVGQKHQNKEISDTIIANKKESNQSVSQNRILTRSTKGLHKRTKNNRSIKKWDPHYADCGEHKLSKVEQSEKDRSKNAVLKYLRKSARNRTQLMELETQLELELGFEKEILGDYDDCTPSFFIHSIKDDYDVSMGTSKSSVLSDLKNLKHSILKMCDDDGNVGDDASSHIDEDSMTSRIEFYEHDQQNLNNVSLLKEVVLSQSDETSLSSSVIEYDQINNDGNSNSYDDTKFLGSQGSEAEKNASSTSLPSNKTLWEGLSNAQMLRIRRRMKEICKHNHQKGQDRAVEQQKNVQSLSTTSTINQSVVNDGNFTAKYEKFDEDLINDCNVSNDDIKDNEIDGSSCLSQIASLISENLHISVERAVDDDKIEMAKQLCVVKQSKIPTPIPAPVHPYTMPLPNDVRVVIENQD